jgi:surfactin synthase thioesterase subunit
VVQASRPASLWLDGLVDKPDAAMTLICFGPAGSGASQFRTWNRLAPAWLRVLGVRLPGREFRHREAPLPDALELARRVAAEIAAQSVGRFGFFGHSFGALLAFETARQLRAAGARQPCWLGVAGRPAPHLLHGYPKTYALPQPEFIEVLRGYGGSDPRILDNPDLMAFFLPVIRVDLEANAEYVHRVEPPLDMPILAMRGKQDQTCRIDELKAWRDLTTAGCVLAEEEGGHFFFTQTIATLVETISAALLASAKVPLVDPQPAV